MEYKKMKRPDIVEEKKFRDFTKKEAEAYFQWFMATKDERIEVLRDYIEEEGKENVELDYTPESLIPLWDWYVDHIVIAKKTDEEIEQEKSKYPEWVTIYEEKISDDTLQICYDISCYFGEVIIRNSEDKAYWGCLMKPKNLVQVKRPVVLGFMGGRPLDPDQITNGLTWRYVEAKWENKEKDARTLIDLYNVWQKKLDR